MNTDTKDISNELWRKYIFDDGSEVIINKPCKIISIDVDGDRLFDAEKLEHFIPYRWIHLIVKYKDNTVSEEKTYK